MSLTFRLVWYHFGFSAADFGYTYNKNIQYGNTYTALFMPLVSYFFLSRPSDTYADGCNFTIDCTAGRS